jgi:thiamine-monophosphate kinase
MPIQVGDVGEFALIARLQRFLQGPMAPHVVRDMGDDCAVLRASPGMELLLTTDTQEEDVHFRREWSTAEDIGWRCLAVNVSDIAAMGGMPLGALVALCMPATLELAFVDALYEGMQELARQYRCPIIGGNITQAAANLSVTIAVLGEVPSGQSVYRSGAQIGDEIWVTGELGGAKAGLDVLRHASQIAPLPSEYVLARYRRPRPRLQEAEYLREHGQIRSLVDLSDGLSSDLAHICEASGVGAQLDAAAIPIHEETRRVAHALQADPLAYALHGGEDFELCLTAPPGHLTPLQHAFTARFHCPLVCVGTIQAGSGITLCHADGTQLSLQAQGYDHFRTSATTTP